MTLLPVELLIGKCLELLPHILLFRCRWEGSQLLGYRPNVSNEHGARLLIYTEVGEHQPNLREIYQNVKIGDDANRNPKDAIHLTSIRDPACTANRSEMDVKVALCTDFFPSGLVDDAVAVTFYDRHCSGKDSVQHCLRSDCWFLQCLS